MLGRTLNLGILAHVDAGKTTLTERLLYAAGVIDEPGSVDRGTTQTDTLALERARGITIKAAVVSFPVGDVTVNLIDTPGHPDFVAEVERVLAVLDGAVLVVSAVEGVQAQTVVLMRALRRLRIPTVVFVNKTDRVGADVGRVLHQIGSRLVPDALVAEAHDAAELVGGDAAALRGHVADGLVVPAFAGSALTGEGVDPLRDGIVELLPTASREEDGPLAAAVFKIERTDAGERIAFVRVFGGTVRVRDRIGDEKVTAIAVFDHGGAVARASASAGEIAKVWGLRSARIGDRIGSAPPPRREFAPPTLEAVVEPVDPAAAQRLRVALDQLAEQDPLIRVRQDGQLSVSIYGEVQKEVLEATLAADYGLAVSFRDTRPIHVERPRGMGEAAELLNAPTNPFPHAQLGLRVEPGEGVEVRFAIADHARVPLYVYKRREEFEAAMDAYIREALVEGLYGWEVVDCVVTVVDSWYTLADGPPSRRGPMATAGDFHGLTPVVLRAALVRAGVVVCEPFLRVRLEVPADVVGAAMAAAARLDGRLDAPAVQGGTAVVQGEVAAARVADLQRQLPGLSRGEGVLESTFAGYRPVDGDPPRRRVSGPR